jgi:hypothetical protein
MDNPSGGKELEPLQEEVRLHALPPPSHAKPRVRAAVLDTASRHRTASESRAASAAEPDSLRHRERRRPGCVLHPRLCDSGASSRRQSASQPHPSLQYVLTSHSTLVPVPECRRVGRTAGGGRDGEALGDMRISSWRRKGSAVRRGFGPRGGGGEDVV